MVVRTGIGTLAILFAIGSFACGSAEDERRAPGVGAPAAAAAPAPGAQAAARAKTYVVDRDSVGGRCDDARRAARVRSASTPWCSLSRAIAAAEPGGTVLVRRGSYPQITVSGGARKLTVRGYRSESPRVSGAIIDSTNVSLRGLRLTDTVLIDEGSRGTRLIDNSISAVRSAVVLQDGVSDVVVEDNRVSAPEGSGVFFSSGPGNPPIVGVTIRGNVFDDMGVTGVNARNFRDLLIEGNEITRVASWDGEVHPNAIRTYGGGSRLVVRGNFIHDNVAQGIFIKDGKVTDVLLENNVVVRTGSSFKDVNIYDVDGLKVVNNTFWGKGMVFQDTATDVLLRNNILTVLGTNPGTPLSSDSENHNLIARGSRWGTDDIARRPRFVDPDRLDYRLAPGSPGVDAGTSDQSPARDRLGSPRVDDPRTPNSGSGDRPYHDIGAHELVRRPTGR